MISLFNILTESEYEKKESAKRSFRTYAIVVLIRTIKKINKNEVEERIRGIEGVTIVKPIESDRVTNLSQKNPKYNYDLYEIKFITKDSPPDKINSIKNDILHSKDDAIKIKGVVSFSPDFETLKKV
jgi:hypothetical protein